MRDRVCLQIICAKGEEGISVMNVPLTGGEREKEHHFFHTNNVDSQIRNMANVWLLAGNIL